jgi:membrane-associated phospholipid phosphatase
MTRLERAVVTASGLATLAVLLPLVVLVRDGWAPLRRWDDHGEDLLRLRGDGPGRDLALVITQLGAPLLLELAALALVVVYVRRGRPRLAGYVAISVLGAELVSALLKTVVERVRPCVDAPSCPGSTSFPSGHSVGAAAFWITVVVLLLPVAGKRAWLLLVVPPVVALTRVLLGVHYPSDVLAGLLVGGCWAAAATALLSGWRSESAHRDVPLEEVAS